MLILDTTVATISLDFWKNRFVENGFKSLLSQYVWIYELCCSLSPEMYLSDNTLESRAPGRSFSGCPQPAFINMITYDIICYVTLFMRRFNNWTIKWKTEAIMIGTILCREGKWPIKKRDCSIFWLQTFQILLLFPETDYGQNLCVSHFIAHNINLSAYLLPLTCHICIFSTLC